jgi:hypothetical protein
MLAGYQLLPNNSIFNTNISAFPLRSDSATLISGAGAATLKYYEIAKPINYTNGSTPTQNMVFYYNPTQNGAFQIPIFPGTFPTDARIEGGWLPSYNNAGGDHHLLTVDTTNGNMADIYNYYAVGGGTSEGCPLCTAQSGVKYSLLSYAMPPSGGNTSDAAGLYLTPLLLRLQDIRQAIATGGTINHALRMTLQNGYLHNAFLWPGTTATSAGAGANYYGERVRLKSSFDISSYSSIAQILLTQLKQYGLIIADGGTGWSVDVEYTKWPKPILDAFLEISLAKPIAPSNFEVVDESGFQLSSSSLECTCNRETVTFTRTSDGVTTSTDVVLTGVAVSFPYDLQQIQVGAPAQTFAALVNIGSVTYTMSPTGIGTLDSSTGLYTPPGSVSSPTTLTVTATSTTNPAVAASFTLNVFPAGPIRLVPGSVPGTYNYSMTPTPYTDTSGNVWYSIGDDGGYSNGIGTVTGTSDPLLYQNEYGGYTGGANDVRFDFIVPNGSYTITYKAASKYSSSGQQLMNLELNGTTVYTNLDLFVASGGRDIAWDDSFSVTVTNNRLSFVQRIANNNGTDIGALQITP